MHSRVAKCVLLIALLAAALAPVRAQSWKILCTGIDTNLRGISAAKIPGSDHIAVWASGSHGVILRSLDDGASWSRVDIPGQPDLDFRGIVAISDTTAYVMASGEAEKSRIYKTTERRHPVGTSVYRRKQIFFSGFHRLQFRKKLFRAWRSH